MAVFNFSAEFWHDDMGRYAYLLVTAFRVAGYEIFFAPSFSFLARLDKYKKLLLETDFRVATEETTPRDSVMCLTPPQQIIVTRARPMSGEAFDEGRQPFQYMMHPKVYQLGMHRKLNELRRVERKGKIVFAGNASRKSYSGGLVAALYGKVPRYELLQWLEQELSGTELRTVTRSNDLSTNRYENNLAIVRSEDVKIAFEDWLSTIASYDFFLACPGADMPMCHNAVEAMAVGCIPLLEYPEFFHPALEHGKNCIVFRGEKDLLEQVRKVLAMNASEIAALRQGVTDYYDACLDPAAWVPRLTAQRSAPVALVYNSWTVKENAII